MTTESEATASPLTARTKALGDGDGDDDKDGGGGGDKTAGTGAAAVDAAAAAHRERLAEVDAQVEREFAALAPPGSLLHEAAHGDESDSAAAAAARGRAAAAAARPLSVFGSSAKVRKRRFCTNC